MLQVALLVLLAHTTAVLSTGSSRELELVGQSQQHVAGCSDEHLARETQRAAALAVQVRALESELTSLHAKLEVCERQRNNGTDNEHLLLRRRRTQTTSTTKPKEACSKSQVNRRIRAMNKPCCGAHNERCHDGQTTGCSIGCANKVLAFWSDCRATFAALFPKSTVSTFKHTFDKCRASEVKGYAQRLRVVNGKIASTGHHVGMYTSQLQHMIDTKFAPVHGWDWQHQPLIDGTSLRHLTLVGDYLADVPLRPPSMFVLKLQGTLKPAVNLSQVNVPRYAALVTLEAVQFSAVIGGNDILLSLPCHLVQSHLSEYAVSGTFDASSLPAQPAGAPWPKRTGHGYMALSIHKGSHNAIRNVRALSNNSDACIGVNTSPFAEIGNCHVGGWKNFLSTEMLQTRCIWTLATSFALVHDNHVHHCAIHALDLDAYTSSSVAWNNLCEDNGQVGVTTPGM